MTEKVLQFGTGRFLRAFADAFIDEGRILGHYDGSIVIVASTPSGRTEQFNRQDCRYTLWTRGYRCGDPISEFHSVTSVSRVLSAAHDWKEILSISRSPHLELILSNTTEIGLALEEGDRYTLPQSFPARLCVLLHQRAIFFDFATSSGLIILPCELVDRNGDLLKNLIMIQAERWNLERRFIDWLNNAVQFYNTLVDRIVPGLPKKTELATAYMKIGFEDELLTICEPYRLWAIEAAQSLQEQLGFLKGTAGIALTPNLEPYMARKIRLLNGGHSLSVPVGLLAGCETILDGMNHPFVSQFIEQVLRKEIGPALQVEPHTVPPYIDELLERWRNPYIHHRLLDITFQSTTKLRHRVVPTLVDYYHMNPHGPAPRLIATGVAAWLRFMRGEAKSDGTAYGSLEGMRYAINDDRADQFFEWWPNEERMIPGFVEEVLSDSDLWGTSLHELVGFTAAVQTSLLAIIRHGVNSIRIGTEDLR